ncbi:hypothetical protein HPS57_06415 [Prevotella sp. PINT]|uniref:hypothetical protein n=1 Tax=Palleniella intestinalis TaxID=2736291 RepID=UPI0015531AC1|nr:hypothetical protein [Palleniella intestinalis]NPD81605.1 hypothetical protein [Palleniella intestinalis]
MTSPYPRIQQQASRTKGIPEHRCDKSLFSQQQQDFAAKCCGATILMVTTGFSRVAINRIARLVWWNHTPLL